MKKLVNGEEVDLSAEEEQEVLAKWEAAIRPDIKAQEKIASLKQASRSTIFAGFNSDALGAVHRYPAKQDGQHFDQTNLIAQHSSALNNPSRTYLIMCSDANGVWERRVHTADQAIKAGEAGLDFVEANRTHLYNKIGDVQAIANDDTLTDDEKRRQIEAVSW